MDVIFNTCNNVRDILYDTDIINSIVKLIDIINSIVKLIVHSPVGNLV